MKRFHGFALALLVLALLPGARAADPIVITATKKTVSSTKGSEQSLPRGQSRATEKLIVYRFELQPVLALGLPEVEVEWMVIIEMAGGMFAPATMGQKGVAIPLGRPVTIETEPVKLIGREWRGGPLPGTVEDKIAGYGVRVLAPDGAVLAEKYDPSSVKYRVDWKQLQAPKGIGLRNPRRLQQPSAADPTAPGAE